RYSLNPNLAEAGTLEIFFELPYERISTRLDIQPAVLEPEFTIIDHVIFSDFHKNGWSGRLKDLKFKININSNSSKKYILNSLDILLYINEDLNPVITADHLNFEINPGINNLVKTVKSDLPARFFMSREIECDLRLYYDTGNTMKVYQINNIPITINNF
ncbi:hypothetical protein LCGC14_3101180, partial [marine sediment metagenome]